MNEGQEEGEFLWFPDIQFCSEVHLAVLSVWKELPRDTHWQQGWLWDTAKSSGMGQEQMDRPLAQRALKTRNKMKSGIKQKRCGTVLARLLTSDF